MSAWPPGSDVNDWLVTESGRIEKDFMMQSRARGIWTNQIKQREFPLGMGEILTKVNFERSNPTVPFAWSALNLNPTPPTSGGGSNANPTTYYINPAWSTYQYQLYYGALQSSSMTIYDISMSLDGPAQLGMQVENLKENVLDIIEDRKQDEYMRICGNKIICQDVTSPATSGFNQDWPATVPDSQINLNYLEYGWDIMMRDGGAAGKWGTLQHVMGQPCPVVFCSPEAQRAIFRQDPDFRKDIRYSSQADRLLNPLSTGAENDGNFPRVRNPSIQDGSSYGHFRFGINLRAPRYNFTGGQFVRVPYYSTSAATLGIKVDPSIAYRNAAYEVAFIFHPATMELCTYDPPVSYDNGVKFNSGTFQGKFMWVNNKDNDKNVDGNQGYFRALLASASRPGLPNLGFAFMYKLCPNNFNGIGCSHS